MNLSHHKSHSIFDIEGQIVRTGNCPSPVDLKIWQERIDQIAGKTLTGKPRLRITWGQQSEMIVCGNRRSTYPFWRIEDGNEIRDIGIPRFFIEELHSHSELRKNDRWDKARYYWDGSTHELIDVLGPIPEDGFYTQVFMIAYHDDLCCSGRDVVKGEICLGAYRPPTDSDLKRIRLCKSRRDTASNDDVAPSQALIEKRTEEAVEKRDERWRSGIREVIDDFMSVHSWKFTEHDPTKLAHGRFHFLSDNNLGKIDNNAKCNSGAA